MGSLSNLYISQSYTSLIHLGSDTTITTSSVELQDGLGNGLGVFVNSLGNVSLNGTFESDLPKGFLWVGDGTNRTSLVSTSSFGDASSIAQLNSFTASATQELTSLEIFSASAKISITNLNTNSASVNTSIANLNSTTASLINSVNYINSFTQSAAISIDKLNLNSASVNTSVDSLNNYSASVKVSISNINSTTSSLNTSVTNLNQFTQSQQSFNSSATASIQQLLSFSSSLDTGYVTEAELAAATASLITQINTKLNTSSFNSYTQSTNIRLNNLENTSASVNVSISNLNSTTQSLNTSVTNLNSTTASLNTSVSNLNSFTQSQQSFNSSATASISQLLSFSSSLDANFVTEAELAAATGSLITQINTKLNTASFNSYTQSNDQRVGSLETNSASVNTSISALNTFTASQSTASIVTSISNLNSFSASALVSISNINSTTASLNTSVTNLNSFTQSAESRFATIGQVTASLNSATASLQGQLATIGGQSGSWITESETGSFVITSSFNSYTESTNVRLNNIESTTASLNTSVSNLNINSASVNTSISNLNTNSASVNVSISSLNTFTASQSTASLVTSINNLNTFSASALVSISNLNSNSASVNTSISNLNSNSASVNVSISNLNTATASFSSSVKNLNEFTQSQLNVNIVFANELTSLESKTGSYATTGSNTFVADQTITGNLNVSGVISASVLHVQYETASVIFSSGSNQLGDELSDIQTLSGSVKVQGSLTVNGTPVLTSSADVTGFVTTASFNAYTQSNNQRVSSLESNSASVNTSITNINSFTQSAIVSIDNINLTTASLNTSISNINTFTQSTNVSISNLNTFTASQSTASLVTSIDNLNQFSASTLVSISNLNTNSASVNTSITNLNTATSSLFTSASLAIVTASVSGQNLTFTKGNGTTFDILIPTASYFTSSISVSGSITISGSIENVDYIDFNTASAVPTWKSGRVFWDNTDGCLAVYNAEADITLQVGQEMWVRARNNTGVTIANGAAVRLVGALGDNPLIVLAQSVQVSGSAITDNQILGLATHTIETGTDGYVTTLGNVRGLNTSAFAQGDVLFVSSSAGLLTNVIPVAPYERIPVATVVKVGPGGSGILYVAPQPPIDFSDLSSVLIEGDYANDDVWIYEGNVWKHKSKSDIGLTTTASFNSYTSSTDVRLSNIESTTASLNTSVSNINSFTQSANVSINALNAATSSYATSAITASSLITASLAPTANTIRFTKGDNTTFDVTLNITSSASASFDTGSFVTTSSFNAYTSSNDQKVTSLISATGSYAITGSNTFRGNQIVSGSLQVLGDNANNVFLYRNGSTNSPGLNIGSIDVGLNVGSNGTFNIESLGSGATLKLTAGGGNNNNANLNFDVSGVGGNDIISITARATNNTASLVIQDANNSIPFIRFEQNPEKTTIYNKVDISGSIVITGSLSASLNNGYVWVGDSNNTTVLVATSSFGGGSTIDTGSFVTTSSFNAYTGSTDIRLNNIESTTASLLVETQNLELFSASALTSINALNGATGSFATTGSNTFTGDQTLTDAAGNTITLTDTSGSLMLVMKGFTSSSLHLSASASGTANLIFKTNNNTADTIISGSSNIFTNAGAPTAGFKRYIGGNGNIYPGGTWPQISGSMGFSPIMNRNIGNMVMTMRGPVSSSTWTINDNIVPGTISIGSSAANNAEKAVSGFTMTGNSVNGTFNFIANRSLHTQGNQITNNLMTTMNMVAASSSIVYTGNIGGISVTNNASGGLVSNQANATFFSQNLFLGTNNSITATGSQDPGDTSGASYLRHIESNAIFGSQNGVNLPNAATGSNSLTATLIAGWGLGITGSNASSLTTLTGTNNGSAFLGRWNAQDDNRALSAQTIFAVGTGTSTSNRKTGFLIDSGSNTFVEGTFNVSGSTRLTGSLSVSGSNTIFSSSVSIRGNTTFTSADGAQGNIMLGDNAMANAVGNTTSVAIGGQAMRYASGSTQNVALGQNALIITSGSNNFGLGSYTLENNTLGSENVALGTGALNKNTTGQRNIGIGNGPLFFNTEGERNIGIGYNAGANASGSNNIFIGYEAGGEVSGSRNVIIGAYKGTAGELRNDNVILSNGSSQIVAQYNGEWQFPYDVNVTGSVSITQTLQLSPLDPLPAGTVGMLAVSGSNLFFYNGAWTQVI